MTAHLPVILSIFSFIAASCSAVIGRAVTASTRSILWCSSYKRQNAFIASPSEKYSFSVVNGAERQRYGDNLIDYIDRVRDPVRFKMEIPYDWEVLQCRDSDNFVTFLSPGNIILVISILVFASLGFVLIRLIKATGQEADEQKWPLCLLCFLLYHSWKIEFNEVF